jgi:VanZ family protein
MKKADSLKDPDEKDLLTAILLWLFTISYMGIIFYVSSLKSHLLPNLTGGVDKAIHVIAYSLLAYMSYFSLRKSGAVRHAFLVSFIFTVIYGFTDELHQLFIPGRIASIGDLIADSFGALSGCLLAEAVNRRGHYRERS